MVAAILMLFNTLPTLCRTLVATSAMPGQAGDSNQFLVGALQLGLGLLDSGYVLGNAEGADDFAGQVAQRHLGGQRPGLAAVFGEFAFDFADHGSAGAHDFLLVLEGAGGIRQ